MLYANILDKIVKVKVLTKMIFNNIGGLKLNYYKLKKKYVLWKQLLVFLNRQLLRCFLF